MSDFDPTEVFTEEFELYGLSVVDGVIIDCEQCYMNLEEIDCEESE